MSAAEGGDPVVSALRAMVVLATGHDNREPSFRELVTAAGLDPGRDLRGGSFRDLDFRDEDLSGFDFTGADLTNADFRRAKLAGAVFTDADLTGTIGFTPPWASAAGDDEFGMWADLTVGKATQRLRWIPPGQFLMGSPDGEAGRYDDEGPVHEVTIATGYWLFDTPCTQAFWRAVMGKNPSEFKSPTRPVETVSFDDVRDFLTRLNAIAPGFGLPSEAQWEYACRAGTQTAAYAAELGDIAWYSGNSGVDFELKGAGVGTHPVGRKAPNAWGLYDMLGNVWEWCADAWHDDYEGAPSDGSARVDGAAGRVIRGGSWSLDARVVRAASRGRGGPSYRGGNLGFRCARAQ